MGQMQIEIIKVSKPEKVKKYETIEVTYKELTNGGKVAGKKLVSFGDYQHIYKLVKDLDEGAVLDVKFEKVNDFWTWVEAELTASKPVADAPAKADTKASPELPARAGKQEWVPDLVKQRLIIRQSCLAQAVNYENGNMPTVDDILKTAERFVDWVFEVNKQVEPAEAPKVKRPKAEKVEVL